MVTRYIDCLSLYLTKVLTIILLVGCSSAKDMPPEIAVDKISCARCSMLISDSRFAAAVKSGPKYLVFDDIGCMLTYSNAHHGVDDEQVWVRDYTTDKWIGAKQALFFHADGDVTPMGYGYIAVASTKPPVGLVHLLQIGSIEQLRTDHASRMKAL